MELAAAAGADTAAAPTRTIDISDIAGPLQWLTMANPVLAVAGIVYPAALIGEFVRGKDIALPLLMAAPFEIAALIAWRNRNGVDALTRRFTASSLLVIAAFYTLITGAAISVDVFQIWACAMLGAAGLSVITLRTRVIPGSTVPLSEIIRRPSGKRAKTRRRRPVVGSVLIVMGLVLILVAAFRDPGHAGFLYAPLYLVVGPALLMLARGCFEPIADDLLSTDNRPPIVFLRAFADDETANPLNLRSSLLDFSIEDRLAAHFNAFGPFVAIGAPGKKNPTIGAARAFLSDAEWQARVKGWIDRASAILWSAGGTTWVFWELEQIINAGKVGQLIIVFPRRIEDPAARLNQLVTVFAGTPWATALAAIEKPSHLRAIQFRPDGGLNLVTADTRNRNSYHLAVLIAHLGLRTPGALQADNPAESDAQQENRLSTIAAALAAVAILASIGLFFLWRDLVFWSDYRSASEAALHGAILVLTAIAPCLALLAFRRRHRRREGVTFALLLTFGWLLYVIGFFIGQLVQKPW